MANRIWNIDGSETVASEGAVIKWEDHIFFTLSYNGQSFKGEILEEKTERNFLKLKINHRVFEIRKKGELDELISAMGLDVPKVRKLKELQAPMPGRIVNIAIVVGQELSVGSNIDGTRSNENGKHFVAEGVGVVKAINYSNNDVVEKGAVIVEFE